MLQHLDLVAIHPDGRSLAVRGGSIGGCGHHHPIDKSMWVSEMRIPG